MQETALIMQITAGKEGEQELITMPRGKKGKMFQRDRNSTF